MNKNKTIKYTPEYVEEIISEAERVGCNMEFSPKALRNLIKAQRDKIKKMIEKEKKAMHDVGTFKYDEIYDELIKQIK